MRQITIALTAALAMFAAGSGWTANTPADKPAQSRAAVQQHLAESLLRDIHQATWISEGSGPGVIYIFFDPNCPYCHRLYLNTRDWIKAGKVRLRWIPVGVLTTTSPGKAAALLGADDPVQAFYDNEDHYSRGGGIDEDIPTPAIAAELKANEALLARTRAGAVPLMLFRLKGSAPFLIQGAPPKEKLPIILRNLENSGAG
jgi:thiol:disulfide interchange protein DsbG